MMVARAIRARNQLALAFEMALPARESPMQMIMGPVTTGGRKRMTRFTPTRRITRASTR